MKIFLVKLNGIIMGCILLWWAGSGLALVSPDHYRKMKTEKTQKTQVTESGQSRPSIQLRVHQPGEGPARSGKPK